MSWKDEPPTRKEWIAGCIAFCIAFFLIVLFAPLARSADLAVPKRTPTFVERFGVWQTNPIAYWTQQNKSSSSPRSSENLTRRSGKKTK